MQLLKCNLSTAKNNFRSIYESLENLFLGNKGKGGWRGWQGWREWRGWHDWQGWQDWLARQVNQIVDLYEKVSQQKGTLS